MTRYIKCPDCGEASAVDEWLGLDADGKLDCSVTIGCEICGDHFAWNCPRCDAWFDDAYTDPPPLQPMKPPESL